MTQSDELKPCDWCGKKPMINKEKVRYCQMHGDRMPQDWIVACNCPTPRGRTKQEAIKAWNTRHTPPQGEASTDLTRSDDVLKNRDIVNALDWCDLMVDEFHRIKSLFHGEDNTRARRLKQLCERAIKNTEQRVPVVEQRDNLISENITLRVDLRTALSRQTVDVDYLRKFHHIAQSKIGLARYDLEKGNSEKALKHLDDACQETDLIQQGIIKEGE